MPADRSGRLRRGLAAAGGRRVLAATATAALLAAGAVALLLGGAGDDTSAGSSDASGPTGKVERRTLAQRLTATGTIGYAGESTVLARLSGTVTALPAVGGVIRRGERLYELDGEPVLLMYGAVPAYRALAEGVDEGRDIEQLKRNLAALGYEPGTIDEEFTSATAAAVSAWQEDLGLEESGAVELGRVAFLPGSRRVTQVEAMLGEAIGSGVGGGLAAHSAEPSTTTLVAYEPESVEVGDAEEAGEGEGERIPEEPESEDDSKQPETKVETPEMPESEEPRGDGGDPNPEAAAGPGAGGEPTDEGEAPDPASVPILKTSSTKRVVSVELDPDQQSAVRRRQRVGVVLPGGEEARGKVERIAVTEGSSSEAPGEESEPGVEVTVSLIDKSAAPSIDGAAVSVLFTQRVREDVLSVPLTALIAIGGERFAVFVREGETRRRIVVTPGLGADGYVEVEGRGLREGMTVETGE